MRILVVGAGILGTALADRLTRPGAGGRARPRDEVTVVEAREPGAGTSGTSYAWLNANDPGDPAYHRFRTAALAAWRDLAAGFGAPAWYRPAGCTTWAADGDARSRLGDRVARLAGLGYAAELIDAGRLRALEPHVRAPRGALIAHYRDEGYVHGGSAARALARRARALGAGFVTGHRAVALTTEGERVTGVRLDDGRDLDADLTVCAAGRHAPALLATAGVTLALVDPSEPGSAAPASSPPPPRHRAPSTGSCTLPACPPGRRRTEVSFWRPPISTPGSTSRPPRSWSGRWAPNSSPVRAPSSPA